MDEQRSAGFPQATMMTAPASGRPRLRLGVGPGLLFVSPAVLVLVTVLAVPILTVVAGSLRGEGALRGTATLQYFRDILQDRRFWGAFANTLLFTAGSVVLHLAVGLPVALLLNQKIPGRKFFRIIIMLPWMLSSVVVAVTWRWLYDAQFGIVNDLLRRAGIMTHQLDILGDPSWAMPAVIVANLWRGFPFMTLILLAALQAIPIEQHDAAAVDGASSWQVFRFVTLPNLLYPLVLVVTLDALFNFRYFDLIQVMTAGGPAGRTEVLTTLVYRSAFESFDSGHASAVAVIMFLVVLGFALVYTRVVV